MSKYDFIEKWSNLSTQNDVFFPIAINIASQTISSELVSVRPMGPNSQEELESIKSDVLIENRDRKVDSIIDDKPFEEMKIEDHKDYKKMSQGKLCYLDFKYES